VLWLLRLLGPYVVWLYPVGALFLLYHLRGWYLASRDLRGSLFTLERELAVARMRRSIAGAFVVLAVLAAIFFAQMYLQRSFKLEELIRPTATPEFIPKTAFVPTPTAAPATTLTAYPTSTRRPTVNYTALPPATLTPVPQPTAGPRAVAPASCTNPGVQITQPQPGARVSGQVEIRGTAKVTDFQFYKIELGLGDHPSRWTSIADTHRAPVANGLLETWDTTSLPPGTYSLRLVVVYANSNFPPPCEVQVVVTAP
jgi:hypothetical protein